ncbi:hypothetical protein MTR67_022493 [Solanum verrucosum]|uniref:Uncharacterized protein n=1 Tax=Solanum verrucosum TaxID=315347 RepID=A0AAF0TXX1_SOLVR|nr:hypothetical protein MTR67_022493 [Solanum verrucosum]
MHCKVTGHSWSVFLSLCGIKWTMPEHTGDLLSCWTRRGGSKSQKRWWGAILHVFGGQYGKKGMEGALRIDLALYRKLRVTVLPISIIWCKEHRGCCPVGRVFRISKVMGLSCGNLLQKCMVRADRTYLQQLAQGFPCLNQGLEGRTPFGNSITINGQLRDFYGYKYPRMRRNMGGEIWEKLTPIIVSSSLGSCWKYAHA